MMTWEIGSADTRVAFSIRHMLISNVHGHFDHVDGRVDFDPAQPARSSVDVQIEAASINTGCKMRDEHLRSADYFDVERYPYLTFRSTLIEVADDSHGKVYGDLTIKGITHEAVLDVEFRGLDRSLWGASSAAFTATATVNRKEYGFDLNPVVVGGTVNISLELQIVEQAAPETVLAMN